MAYDENLADRVRDHVLGEPGLTERRMFGGLAFMINGNMAVTASRKGGLMLRVDPAQTDDLIADPVADRFLMRGRELDGWLHVSIDNSASDEELERWVDRGVTYAKSLPAKR
jgi:TfoX/Sxy family transcriptional regulator of competence genes